LLRIRYGFPHPSSFPFVRGEEGETKEVTLATVFSEKEGFARKCRMPARESFRRLDTSPFLATFNLRAERCSA
jgi:hypothetical protein